MDKRRKYITLHIQEYTV